MAKRRDTSVCIHLQRSGNSHYLNFRSWPVTDHSENFHRNTGVAPLKKVAFRSEADVKHDGLKSIAGRFVHAYRPAFLEAKFPLMAILESSRPIAAEVANMGLKLNAAVFQFGWTVRTPRHTTGE